VVTASSLAPATAAPELLDLECPEWAEFALEHPETTGFHDPRWAIFLADCYGFRAFAFVMRDQERGIRAGLPVVEVRMPLKRPKWVSLPFTDRCTPLLSAPGDGPMLVTALEGFAAEAGIARTEIRAEVVPAGHVAEAVTHTLSLQRDPSAVFAGFHRSQVQRNVRRAEREGVSVRRADSIGDLTETFYDLHVATRRRLGVPVQRKRFFRMLWRDVLEPGAGYALLATKGTAAIAGAVFLTSRHVTTYKFGASDARALSARPNHAVFWEAIRAACEAGHSVFDFGRTDLEDTGLRAFKSGWGAEEEALVYSVLGEPTRLTTQSPRTWAHLLRPVIRRSPTWVCRSLGAGLYRYTA
jgi:CelD/BcsL family acetyltransferase involved in cellulose biosynthesis